MFLPFLLISPFHVILFTYLAYVEVGWPAFLATVFIVLQVPLQILLGSAYAKFRSSKIDVDLGEYRIVSNIGAANFFFSRPEGI